MNLATAMRLAAAGRDIGGGGGVQPDGIANLSGWWDFSDGTTVTVSGTTVTAVADKSTNNYDLTTIHNNPQWGTRTINSLDVIDFSSDGLYRASTPINNATDGSWTIFAVGQHDTLGAGQQSFVDADDNPRIGQFLRTNGTALETIGFDGGTGYFDVAGVTVATGTPYIATSLHTGTSLEVFHNGTGNGATSTGGAQNYDSSCYLSIGYRSTSSTNLFDGMIGEVICYSRDLTATEQGDIEAYLAAKWGITL